MRQKAFVIFLIYYCLLCYSCQPQESNKLLIATAANMQFAMTALTAEFTKQTGIICEPIIGSSGKLTAQIKAGAPYAVFVSADSKYPQTLYEEGHTINAPKTYAYGQLVLWTHKEALPLSLELLNTTTIRHIALANPKTAPYGRATMEVLAAYDLTKKVQAKLVFGESIAQVNQFVSTMAAEVGFTAKSVVVAPTLETTGHWIPVDTNAYSAIQQGIVLLRNDTARIGEAQQFYDFIFSKEGQIVLKAYGYLGLE